MVVLNKYLSTGNKHLANKRCLAWYRNSKKVFPGLSTSSSLLFCKYSDTRCKTCPNAQLHR